MTIWWKLTMMMIWWICKIRRTRSWSISCRCRVIQRKVWCHCNSNFSLPFRPRLQKHTISLRFRLSNDSTIFPSTTISGLIQPLPSTIILPIPILLVRRQVILSPSTSLARHSDNDFRKPWLHPHLLSNLALHYNQPSLHYGKQLEFFRPNPPHQQRVLQGYRTLGSSTILDAAKAVGLSQVVVEAEWELSLHFRPVHLIGIPPRSQHLQLLRRSDLQWEGQGYFAPRSWAILLIAKAVLLLQVVVESELHLSLSLLDPYLTLHSVEIRQRHQDLHSLQ